MNALQAQAEELAMQQITACNTRIPSESDTTPSAFSVPISDLPPLSDELILGLLAKESSSRADNAAILEYFNEHPDLAERSAFCKHCYKQIYTYLFVDDNTVGFIRHDMYLELGRATILPNSTDQSDMGCCCRKDC